MIARTRIWILKISSLDTYKVYDVLCTTVDDRLQTYLKKFGVTLAMTPVITNDVWISLKCPYIIVTTQNAI